MPASSDPASGIGERWERRIAAALTVVAIGSSILVVALMVFLVIARYILGLSVVGLHELILVFAIQLYMSGALIASQRKTHLTVDWLSQRLAGERARIKHDAVVAMITLIVACFFVVWAYWMLRWGMKRPQTTPALGIPLLVAQASIIVAAIGCTAFALRDVIRAGLALRRPR